MTMYCFYGIHKAVMTTMSYLYIHSNGASKYPY